MDAVSTTSNLTKEERESIRSRINQTISFAESVDLDFFLSFMNHDVSDTNIMNFKDKNSSNSLVHFKYIFVFQFEHLSPQYPASIVYIENSTDGKARKEWAYILHHLTQKLKENDFITVFHISDGDNGYDSRFHDDFKYLHARIRINTEQLLSLSFEQADHPLMITDILYTYAQKWENQTHKLKYYIKCENAGLY